MRVLGGKKLWALSNSAECGMQDVRNENKRQAVSYI